MPSRQKLKQDVVEQVETTEGCAARLEAIFRHWFGWQHRANLEGSCPLAAASFELDNLPSELRQYVIDQENRWRSFLYEQVALGVKEGFFPSELDVEFFVWEFYGIYLSYHVSDQFVRDPKSMEYAQRAFGSLLARNSAKHS